MITTKEEFDNQIVEDFKFAEDEMNRTGGLHMMLVFGWQESDGQVYSSVIVLGDEEMVEKRGNVVKSIGLIMGSHKNKGEIVDVEYIKFFSEAWMSRANKDTKDFIMPSKDPNKFEAVIVAGMMKDGYMTMVSKEIKRMQFPNASDKTFIQLLDMKIDENPIAESKSNLLEGFYETYQATIAKGLIVEDKDTPFGRSIIKDN